ncbi:hypothetical protein K402DRAFT_399140 [Aulographum hederae CBS 113979]|uniref:Pre-mRNA-splicing factor cef1 n=1 Tax=Aulographum hederae CBS 113979 TaxID=1176131 RepID=A0A6G1GJ56_9PEZI|nr:hypothetical protein K402DRAFT_399140 [Aulographum hederae CBS 113979]
MVYVKGGVWTNIEDEILKASISKYGLNQWARVSSLLGRKTAKQCKTRWTEWLDPAIRKIEWSREEDEKLLHLAKLMPTQWRTIASTVGRTASQCLERYGKLLDQEESAARKARKERKALEKGEGGFDLTGPDDPELAAPSADDVRKLRPGELDPDPESKPARPDTIDMDEDEKEMLSEARARLANTQGKKAKRKARERQMQESMRIAQLGKRRELKNAGINIKITTRKPGEMDYNADIPFEKAPAPGFFDTKEEEKQNEREREAFDPRKQQLSIKRKGGPEDEDRDSKKRKGDKSATNAAVAAAKAGQMAKIREAEQNSKRRGLNLPAPLSNEDDIDRWAKSGITGERATQAALADGNSTNAFIGNYSSMMGNTPLRTPRAPQGEDRIENEIRNALARNETQSALLGGENAELHEGEGTTGFAGIAPTKQQSATPNPMATPFRQGFGPGATPMGAPGATPMMTPRDNLKLNSNTSLQVMGQTQREIKLREKAAKDAVRNKLSALPAPKDMDWELELPEEQQEVVRSHTSAEDAAIRDERNEQIRKVAELENFKRQTQVVQRGLPIPSFGSIRQNLQEYNPHPMGYKTFLSDEIEQEIWAETLKLMAHDCQTKNPREKEVLRSLAEPVEPLSTEALATVNAMVDLQISSDQKADERKAAILKQQRDPKYMYPGIWDTMTTTPVEDKNSLAYKTWEATREAHMHYAQALEADILTRSTDCNKLEKTLLLHHGGYMARAKMLKERLYKAQCEYEDLRIERESRYMMFVGETAAVKSRLERGRSEVATVARREREAQEKYRGLREELEGLKLPESEMPVGEGEDVVMG